MSARTFEEFESGVDEITDFQEPPHYSNLSTKLERRRRIEELEEEKRLREELEEF
ncbi:PA3496 family putative envelope integrity protein [Legionella londiniensis]|uniref:Uncharacterized protein n=1 Tax=Legionella londiniensis TaxID=45068 RepID=A0A0W0VSZ3_9GAMM|nr:hypothetical protein [Legionella londiniensis]KTD22953.1 hypothetical protein Llon_0343 [Legionella londiniensis]STX92939.1 Uncharacterised protein [Legionella londiniensis]